MLAAWSFGVVVACTAVVAVALPAGAGAQERLPGNLGTVWRVSCRARRRRRARASAIGPRRNQGRLAIRIRSGASSSTSARRWARTSRRSSARAGPRPADGHEDTTYGYRPHRGFLAVDKAPRWRRRRASVRVLQALPARTRVGAVTSQGVHEERIHASPTASTAAASTIAFSRTPMTRRRPTPRRPADRPCGQLTSPRATCPVPGNPLNAQPVVVLQRPQRRPDRHRRGPRHPRRSSTTSRRSRSSASPRPS